MTDETKPVLPMKTTDEWIEERAGPESQGGTWLRLDDRTGVLRVPGGMIVRSIVRMDKKASTSMVFVPDPPEAFVAMSRRCAELDHENATLRIKLAVHGIDR